MTLLGFLWGSRLVSHGVWHAIDVGSPGFPPATSLFLRIVLGNNLDSLLTSAAGFRACASSGTPASHSFSAVLLLSGLRGNSNRNTHIALLGFLPSAII